MVEPMGEGAPQQPTGDTASAAPTATSDLALTALGQASPDASYADLSMLDEPESAISQARLQAVALPAELVRSRAAPPTSHQRAAVQGHAVKARTVRTVLRALVVLPSLCVLAAALWAAVVAAGSLVALIHLLVSLQFAEAVGQLPSLDAAGRVVLASAGYFALLFALRPFATGMRSQGLARLRMLPAVLVALPSAWLFVAGTGLAAAVPPFSALPADVWRVVVLCLLIQLIALAVLTTQQPIHVPFTAKSSRSASGRFKQPSGSETLEASTQPMPMVRFGPPTNPPARDDEDVPVFRVSGLLSNPPRFHPDVSTAEPSQ